MGIALIIIYLISCLFVARWVCKRSEGKSKYRIWASWAYLSPLLALGWLQEKARNKLDIWFEAKG